MLSVARLPRVLRSMCLTGSLVSAVAAQCANVWLPGSPLAGIDGHVRATASWDPDGAGPAPEVMAFGGTFGSGGTTVASCVVTWEPVTGAWAALGAGITSTNAAAP